jgi:CRP/FNR family cyclic AMP-dependent transcriptional regulator
MVERRKQSFDVEVFLNTVDGGRSVSKYLKDQKVYSQGDSADSVLRHESFAARESEVL